MNGANIFVRSLSCERIGTLLSLVQSAGLETFVVAHNVMWVVAKIDPAHGGSRQDCQRVRRISKIDHLTVTVAALSSGVAANALARAPTIAKLRTKAALHNIHNVFFILLSPSCSISQYFLPGRNQDPDCRRRIRTTSGML